MGKNNLINTRININPNDEEDLKDDDIIEGWWVRKLINIYIIYYYSWY